MSDFFRILIIVAGIFAISSCSKQSGCIDPNASNYVYEAKKDDGTCLYDMCFWAQSGDFIPAYITVDGVLRDSLMCYWPRGKPTCGVDTFLPTNIGWLRCTVNIPASPGNHSVKIAGRDGTMWEDDIRLGENCLFVLIDRP